MREFLAIILVLLIPQIGQSSLKKGDFAPNFSLISSKGEKIEIYQLHHIGIIIKFLSTKCFACDYVISDINRLYNKVKREDIEIIGVLFNDEIKETKELFEFAKERGIQYPLFLCDAKIKKLYNIYGFPTFFVLNRDKRIVQIYRGITQDMFGLLNRDLEFFIRRY